MEELSFNQSGKESIFYYFQYKNREKYWIHCLNSDPENSMSIWNEMKSELKSILQHINPQDVYSYEWYNQKCGSDCDDKAMAAVHKLFFFGSNYQEVRDILSNIQRINEGSCIDAIISLSERGII